MQKKITILNKGKRISAIIHIPKKLPAPVVVLCHGFTSSKVNKGAWADYLCKKGFIAFRFDFNGHGESYGNFLDFTITKCVSDLKSAVAFLKKQKFVKKIGITGHSLGGQVLMIYAAKNKIDAVAPISAVFSLNDIWVMKNIDEWKKKGIRYFNVRGRDWSRRKKPLSYNFAIDRQKYDMKVLTKKIKCPVLIMHGDKDEDIPLSHARMYYKNINVPKKLVVLKGTKHTITRKKDLKILYEETSKWFSKYL